MLEALFKLDKIKWFEQMLITDPTQEQLANIENLQKEFLHILKSDPKCTDAAEVGNFCKRVMQTPVFQEAISDLLICMFIP